ncbi:hypothetical protein BFW01_g8777 [Lasiodiplodia theobromae]|nr:hypothetical protein BFW01_g8777 [Lasiodiplodia theobromae]
MAEAAGLVLGGIPIMVTGIKMLLEGVSAGNRYFKYKLPLQTLHNQLSSEQTIYLNMCEELLNGVVDDVQKEILLENPYGDAWKTPELEGSLKARLSRSYPEFEARVRSMQESIVKLKELLKVDDQGKININAGSKLEKVYKRLKLSIKHSEYENYVTKIRQDNLVLMTMLGQNLRLEASRASKRICHALLWILL